MLRIAIIPARAQSKGIPGKNLKIVGGRSLVVRAIQAAKDCSLFDKIIVSTDGEEIAREARGAGADVVMRPLELSADDSRTIDAIEHVLKHYGYDAGMCVLLQPTSPLRSGQDVQQAVALWEQHGRGSVVAVTEVDHHPLKMILKDEMGFSPVRDHADLEAPRQALPLAFRVNGAIYVNSISDLLAERSFLVAPIVPYEMPAQRSIDIDSVADLKLANSMIGDEE